LKSEDPSPYLVWMMWVGWTPLFIPTLVGLFRSHPTSSRLIVTLVGVTLFFGIYLSSSWLDARHLAAPPPPSARTPARVWLVIVALTTLGIALILINGGNDWLSLFYYVSGYMGGRLSAIRTMLVAIALMLCAVATGLLTHNGWNAIGQAFLFIAVIGAIIIGLVQVVRTSQKLRMAREEIARLAVTAERLRIARDLHDLLGHNLSLITLKSELAGRLIAVLPERAAMEIKEIEQVARTTLQEVREAVSSYRQPALMSELHAAREILTAAGIIYRFEGDEEMITAIPPAIEVTLSWVVREGVTNVIKHSRARHCLIRLKRDTQAIYTEIVDDGATSPGEMGNKGNGLRGLAERMSALGGQFEAAPCAGDGFRLAVCAPLTPRKNIGAQEPQNRVKSSSYEGEESEQ